MMSSVGKMLRRTSAEVVATALGVRKVVSIGSDILMKLPNALFKATNYPIRILLG